MLQVVYQRVTPIILWDILGMYVYMFIYIVCVYTYICIYSMYIYIYYIWDATGYNGETCSKTASTPLVLHHAAIAPPRRIAPGA